MTMMWIQVPDFHLDYSRHVEREVVPLGYEWIVDELWGKVFDSGVGILHLSVYDTKDVK
jgi:hypothetical protein